MDKIYNKNEVTAKKFAPLNNSKAVALCKFYNALCKTYKTNLCLYVKKTVAQTATVFIYLVFTAFFKKRLCKLAISVFV